jgi:hypothetical protein
MTLKTNARNVYLFIVICMCISCTKEPEFKADSIIGYWQCLEEISATKNGIQTPIFTKGFYTRFLDNNCGMIYDQDETWTNDIKWAFQERSEEDLLLISTALNANGAPSDFSFNRIHYIEKFEENNFRTFAIEFDTIENDVFIRSHTTLYVRQ